MTWRRYRKCIGPLLAALGVTFVEIAEFIETGEMPDEGDIAMVSAAWGALFLVWRLPNDA